MATTTATINITTDIAPTASISKTMTMHKLQSSTGLEETSGLRTKKFTAASAAVVVEQDEFTSTKASKVYMRNTGSSKVDYFYEKDLGDKFNFASPTTQFYITHD